MTKSPKTVKKNIKFKVPFLTSYIYQFIIIIITWNIFKVKVMNTVYMNRSLKNL